MSAPREALVEEVCAQINALMSFRRRAFCTRPPQREVSLPQLHVLTALHELGPVTVSELAQMLHTSAPSASAIVDRLEEPGLVRRVRDAIDRRVVHVEISEQGSGVVEELIGLKRDMMQRLLGAMSEDELQDVMRGVAALRSGATRLRWNVDNCEGETAHSDLEPACERGSGIREPGPLPL